MSKQSDFFLHGSLSMNVFPSSARGLGRSSSYDGTREEVEQCWNISIQRNRRNPYMCRSTKHRLLTLRFSVKHQRSAPAVLNVVPRLPVLRGHGIHNIFLLPPAIRFVLRDAIPRFGGGGCTISLRPIYRKLWRHA